MPFVSGFVVPKMNSTSHVGNIRLLRPVVVSIERKEDNQAENDHTKDAEEPEEILHLRSSEKIFIDLTDMLLHLSSHPFVFVVEHGLNLLPVGICDSD